MSSIANLFSEWNSLQPLKAVDQARLDKKFMLEFNFNSNHIEGNTLTYGQTEFLLLFGQAINNANMRDLEDMKASNVCLEMVKEEALNPEHHLTEYFIRTLHKTLLREDYTYEQRTPDGGIRTKYTIHAGIYKTRPNSVITRTGERFEYASPEETPALMADLLQWYNDAEKEDELSPIELAALFHYRYIRIHPFEDGNGRISRLIVNYILARKGYPMIVVKSADKNNYLLALNKCDLNTEPIPSEGARATIDQARPLVAYLSQCLEQSLILCIKAAKGESIEEPDDFAKELGLIERKARKEKQVNTKLDPIQEKINVFNFFHRALASNLFTALDPARIFFSIVRITYCFSKQKKGLNIGNFFTLNADVPLTKDLPTDYLEIIRDAQSILLHISFEDVKAEYNIKEIRIFLEADVLFDTQSYTFDGQQYAYGEYPDYDAINNFIGRIKQNVLATINNSLIND